MASKQASITVKLVQTKAGTQVSAKLPANLSARRAAAALTLIARDLLDNADERDATAGRLDAFSWRPDPPTAPQ